jgi:hypothetical protein
MSHDSENVLRRLFGICSLVNDHRQHISSCEPVPGLREVAQFFIQAYRAHVNRRIFSHRRHHLYHEAVLLSVIVSCVSTKPGGMDRR